MANSAVPVRKDNIIKGIVCILFASLGFAGMAMFVKLAGDIDPMQKTFFRNIIAALVAFVVMVRSGEKIKWPTGSGTLLIVRCIFGTLGILLNFYAVDHLYLGDATILQKIAPFVIVILSAIVFKERITKFQMGAVAIGFLGILFVVKPSGASLISPGAAAAILGAIAAGSAYTCVRGLSKRGVQGSFIVFFFSAFSVVVLAPYVLLNFEPMTTEQWLMLLGVGACATVGQFGITYGYAFAPAKSVSVFEYTQVLFAALFGFLVFSEVPDIHSWIGYVIISGVGIAMLFKGAQESKHPSQEQKSS